MRPVKLTVFCSGAVGAYFGGRLAEAGEDVAFVREGRCSAPFLAAFFLVTKGIFDFPADVCERAADAHFGRVAPLAQAVAQVVMLYGA
jgi:hypothetical protein